MCDFSLGAVLMKKVLISSRKFCPHWILGKIFQFLDILSWIKSWNFAILLDESHSRAKEIQNDWFRERTMKRLSRRSNLSE